MFTHRGGLRENSLSAAADELICTENIILLCDIFTYSNAHAAAAGAHTRTAALTNWEENGNENG